MQATYHGIPVIGLPLFGDQCTNMGKTVAMGAGLKLEWNDLMEDQIYTAIQTILTDRRSLHQTQT